MGGGTHSRAQARSQIGETGSFLGPSGVVERLPYQNEHPRYVFVRIVQSRRIYAGYNIIRTELDPAARLDVCGGSSTSNSSLSPNCRFRACGNRFVLGSLRISSRVPCGSTRGPCSLSDCESTMCCSPQPSLYRHHNGTGVGA